MIAPRENAHCPTGHKNTITDCKAHESGGESGVGGGGGEVRREGGGERRDMDAAAEQLCLESTQESVHQAESRADENTLHASSVP